MVNKKNENISIPCVNNYSLKALCMSIKGMHNIFLCQLPGVILNLQSCGYEMKKRENHNIQT